jgi:hypothetical protein
MIFLKGNGATEGEPGQAERRGQQALAQRQELPQQAGQGQAPARDELEQHEAVH